MSTWGGSFAEEGSQSGVVSVRYSHRRRLNITYSATDNTVITIKADG